MVKGDWSNLTLNEFYEKTTDKVVTSMKKKAIIETDSRQIFRTEDGKSIQNLIDMYISNKTK